MRAKLIITAVLAMSMLVMGATGSVAAHDGGTQVGASGNCDDANGNGGGGSVGVGGEDGVDAVSPSEVQNTAEGLAFFAQQKNDNPDRPDTCDGSDDTSDTSDPEEGDDDYDYLEAHAGAQGNSVQYCYSEDNSGGGGSGGQGDQCHS